MPTPADRERLAQTVVIRCANNHLPLTYYSRRDQPVPCPVCGRVPETLAPKESR